MSTPPAEFPATLLAAIKYFANADVSLAFMVSMRWPSGVVRCPVCDCERVGFLATRRLWKCKGCAKQFSVKVGTIFEDSPLGLDKWLPAVWCIVNAKNGISSCELARALGVTQKTAWFMLHRIRLAMESGTIIKGKSNGVVEADESYIGGQAKYMHKDVKERKGIRRGFGADKTAVVALLDRHTASHSKIVAHKVLGGTVNKKDVVPTIKASVHAGAEIHTDQSLVYEDLHKDYLHEIINHAECYVRNNVIHTNGLENFWSLLKRALRGTYVSVQPCHLFRYVAEQVFRFNERKDKDGDSGRFVTAMAQIFGKRITYQQLIAEDGHGLPA